MLNAGFFPAISFVLLFALLPLGLTDEKDFLFVFPLPPSALSSFFSAFPLLLAYGHCNIGVRGGLRFFGISEGFSLFYEQRPFSSLRVE